MMGSSSLPWMLLPPCQVKMVPAHPKQAGPGESGERQIHSYKALHT